MLSSLTRKCNGPRAKDMGQVYHLQEKRKILNVFSFRPVTVGSVLHPSGSKLETQGVSRHHSARVWGLDQGWTCVCACVCVGGGVDMHTCCTSLS